MTEHEASDVLPAITTTDGIELSPASIEKPIPSVHVWGEAKALIRDVLFAALTAVLLVVFIIQPVKVEGTSMLPRLHDGERIFVNKFVYAGNDLPWAGFSIGRPIARGDVSRSCRKLMARTTPSGARNTTHRNGVPKIAWMSNGEPATRNAITPVVARPRVIHR